MNNPRVSEVCFWPESSHRLTSCPPINDPSRPKLY
jgi:hypothetical protein